MGDFSIHGVELLVRYRSEKIAALLRYLCICTYCMHVRRRILFYHYGGCFLKELEFVTNGGHKLMSREETIRGKR